jgi:membrane fusion protein (multidrug efflux system)
MMVPTLRSMVLLGLPVLLTSPAMGQAGPGAPPAVGVITAQKRPMAESTEINGRIQAPQRVNVVARVTAFMNERLFAEGADIKTGDLLYKLERAPFEADVEAKQGAVAQAQAQLENANVTLSRAQELLENPQARRSPLIARLPQNVRLTLNCNPPGPSSINPRSISTTPKFVRRSMVGSVAPR